VIIGVLGCLTHAFTMPRSPLTTRKSAIKAFDGEIIKTAAVIASSGAVGYVLGSASADEAVTSLLAPLQKPLYLLLSIFGDFPKKTLIFPNTTFPVEERKGQLIDELLYVTGTSSIEIGQYGFTASKLVDQNIVGKPKYIVENGEKVANFPAFEKYFSNYVNFDFAKSQNKYLPEDYKYFGVNDGVGNLQAFVKYNPFVASALSSKTGFFEDGFDIDPYKSNTFYSRAIGLLDEDVPRVVASFDKNLKVVSLKAYTGKTLATRKPVYLDKSNNDLAYDLLFNIIFFAEHVHATIHLFHLLLTTGISRSTVVAPDINAWAKPYNINIQIKYQEVELALMSDGGFFNSASGKKGVQAGPAIDIRELASDYILTWGKFKTAKEFVEGFLFKDIKKDALDKSGIAVAFRKQVDLISGFSGDLDKVFKTYTNYEDANKNFAYFTRQTGPKGIAGVTSIKQFVELQSVTGLIHGSTLSLTRLAVTPPIIALFDRKSDKFTKTDAALINLIGATIVGSLKGYSVFSSTIPSKARFETVDVLKKYEEKSRALQVKHYDEIKKNKEYFKKFGWIQSDHGPEGIDGKQYTISTYI